MCTLSDVNFFLLGVFIFGLLLACIGHTVSLLSPFPDDSDPEQLCKMNSLEKRQIYCGIISSLGWLILSAAIVLFIAQ